eukprot:166364-Pyramimonas_sp.AAC.1
MLWHSLPSSPGSGAPTACCDLLSTVHRRLARVMSAEIIHAHGVTWPSSREHGPASPTRAFERLGTSAYPEVRYR